jgi:hypothetical protein
MLMTPEEFLAIQKLAGSFGIGALTAAVVTFLVFRSYVSPYLGEKAKNLATKEDIEAITRKIEAIRTENALVVEDSKASHQLRRPQQIADCKRIKRHLRTGESYWHVYTRPI